MLTRREFITTSVAGAPALAGVAIAEERVIEPAVDEKPVEGLQEGDRVVYAPSTSRAKINDVVPIGTIGIVNSVCCSLHCTVEFDGTNCDLWLDTEDLAKVLPGLLEVGDRVMCVKGFLSGMRGFVSHKLPNRIFPDYPNCFAVRYDEFPSQFDLCSGLSTYMIKIQEYPS